MSYAVIRTGGKQYRVTPGDIIRVEKLPGEPGTVVDFPEVLMMSDAGAIRVGAPLIEGARVSGQVLEQGRAKKILIFKKKKRKNYRRRQGHRQSFTAVRVTAIEASAVSSAETVETGTDSHGT